METLDEASEELVTLLNFHIEGAMESSDPIEQISNAGAVCIYYQGVGISELLLDAEVDAFFHHLIRSAQSRLWVLEHCQALSAPPLKLFKASNTGGFHAALAARQWDLARRIAQVSPTACLTDVEYEDDFCSAHFLHRYMLEAPPQELHAVLGRFEAVLEGDKSPWFELCRYMLARDHAGCARAFASLLEERTHKLTKMKRESVYATDSLFLPQSSIFVEGLAWLSLMERAGIPTEAEYPYCPSLARRVKYAPFEVTTFPSLPL
jgi:hypothetical protein